MKPAPRALCFGHPRPELWFSFSALQQRAVAVCKQCPVRDRCLDHAIERPEVHGVWGGLTANQRREIVEASGREFVEPESRRPLRRDVAGTLVDAR